MKPSRGREPLADRVKRNAAGLAMYASAAPADKSREPIFAPEPEKPARAPRKTADGPLESHILQEIIAYLESRGDIGAIVRTNSGVAVNDNRYTRFNTCLGKHNGEYMTLLDLQCIHKPTGRHIEIEAKRGLWKYSGRANEVKQQARIWHLIDCGAVAFFATSAIEVQHMLSRVL